MNALIASLPVAEREADKLDRRGFIVLAPALAVAALSVSACGRAASTPPVVTIGHEGAALPASTARAPVARSCPARTPARTLDLHRAHVAGDVAGVTFATAVRRDGDRDVPVLVWLAPDGSLAEHPIARAEVQRALSGTTLHLLGMPLDWSALFVESIDLSTPDAPRRRRDDKLTRVPAGVLGPFAADETRLVIAEIVSTGGANVQTTYIVDRATGSAVERKGFWIGEASFCDGTGCTLVATDSAAKRSIARWEPHAGGAGVEVEVFPFPGNYVHRVDIDGGALLLEPGERGFTGAIAERSPPRLRALPAAPAPSGLCRSHNELPGPLPGVVTCDGAARTLVRWDPERRVFGVVEPLPPTSRDQEIFAAHEDGVIRVAWESGSGLMHGAEFQGIREYHTHWTFQGGEASLLKHDGARWIARDEVPLVLRDAHGEFSRGYSPAVLVRGPRAAVLLSSDGLLDPAHLQPLREPCPEARGAPP